MPSPYHAYFLIGTYVASRDRWFYKTKVEVTNDPPARQAFSPHYHLSHYPHDHSSPIIPLPPLYPPLPHLLRLRKEWRMFPKNYLYVKYENQTNLYASC